MSIPLFVPNIEYPVWQRRSACAKKDPKIFFPKTETKHSTEKAREICNTECTVKKQCLEWILYIEKHEGTQNGGIYAGLTAKERKKLRRCLFGECTNIARSVDKKTTSRWSNRFCSDEHEKAYKLPRTTNPENEYYMKGTIRGQGTAFS